MNERVVLGRGLKALIAEGESGSGAKGAEQLLQLSLDLIRRNPDQPRRSLDEKALAELAQSIREKGVIQPIVVQRRGLEYEVIAGERRLRAARLAGLTQIPAIVRDVTDERERLELAIIENIQREDLNPLDRALGYRRLLDEFGETQQSVADRVGKDRATIANTLRILDLPPEVQELIRGGEINLGQARALLALSSREEQIRWAQQAARGGLSVRALERLAARKKAPRRPPDTSGDPHLEAAIAALRDRLQARVAIKRNRRGGGRIEIDYYSQEELTRICELLGLSEEAPEASRPGWRRESFPFSSEPD